MSSSQDVHQEQIQVRTDDSQEMSQEKFLHPPTRCRALERETKTILAIQLREPHQALRRAETEQPPLKR